VDNAPDCALPAEIAGPRSVKMPASERVTSDVAAIEGVLRENLKDRRSWHVVNNLYLDRSPSPHHLCGQITRRSPITRPGRGCG
jgi:hypothetical protein